MPSTEIYCSATFSVHWRPFSLLLLIFFIIPEFSIVYRLRNMDTIENWRGLWISQLWLTGSTRWTTHLVLPALKVQNIVHWEISTQKLLSKQTRFCDKSQLQRLTCHPLYTWKSSPFSWPIWTLCQTRKKNKLSFSCISCFLLLFFSSSEQYNSISIKVEFL